MTVKVAINGFGRIGRNILRAIHESGRKDIQVVAINDLGPVETNAHLLRFDSVHGRYPGTVGVDGDHIVVDGKKILVTAIKDPAELPHAKMGMAQMNHGGSTMKHDMREEKAVNFPVGPGVDMIAPMPAVRLDHPGIGLDKVEHKVLNYTDLVARTPDKDLRAPTRRIDVHLTGNMERFMWSMDGEKLSENPEPYRFARNERVRMRMINDSMMTHPMHLHGHFFSIVNGHGSHQPMKHTVRVLPGSIVEIDFTADAPGDWAFHCHMLYHMHAGMMRVVTVRPLDGGKA